MAAAFALLPEAKGGGDERVTLDPALAAYVRSILPRNVAKYWMQRYSLFTLYDQGIQVCEWSVRVAKYWMQRYSLFTLYDQGIQVCEWSVYSGNKMKLEAQDSRLKTTLRLETSKQGC